MVVGFALLQSNGVPGIGDLYLVAALVMCAAGYAEGGRLSSRIPGWPVHLSARGVAGLLYIAAVSQFLGFVVWYRGMALMGIARASQLQLMQPLLTLVWAVLLLGEPFSPDVVVAAVLVLACVALPQRTRA